ncbi:CopG family ribbon-helix-helix protein [Candidatus Methanarcanum hacksteinii]|uniref:CopG family ribbon-helix-helix protein n=1 Tax=Candidatus Methanarcanum hacksteinii TaxID=2911857 RepID=UPI0037DC59B1
MAIVSVSLSDEYLEELDSIQNYYGLNGRSEAIRHSIKSAETEMKEISDIDGHVEGVLVIVHGNHDDMWMSKIYHRYEGQIKTQLHSHLLNMKCLEVMIMSTDSSTMRNILKEIYSVGKADYVKFVRG